MNKLLKHVLLLGALSLSFAAAAEQAGQLPLRIVTGEVEQPPLFGPDTPEFRRTYASNPEKLTAAIEAQERHTDALLLKARASATAVGWNDSGEPVIKVYTNAETELSQIPGDLDGITVQVEQSGNFYALSTSCENRDGGDCDNTSVGAPAVTASADPEPGPRERHPRPVPIGVSVGHVDSSSGTIACRTSDGCHTYFLSNAHVVAQVNSGQPGDPIVQPSRGDGGTRPADVIGGLSYSVPIVMSTTADNKVDAAIVVTHATLVGIATPSTGYGAPKSNPTNPSIGLNVMKFGRSSEMTYGYIDAVNATVLVDYGGGKSARFIGQMFIRGDNGDFSRGGDSGSLVVASGGSTTRRPVGLMFASGGGITAANPITDVLRQVGIVIDGE
jgi:hypothetical protein